MWASGLRLDHTIFADDFRYLQSVAAPGSTPKLTIPSPNMVHYRGGPAAIDQSVYPDMEQFWADLSAAYAAAGAGDRQARLHATSSWTTPAWPT